MNIATRLTLIFFIVAATGFYFLIDRMRENLVPRYRESTEEPLVDIATILASGVSTELTGASINPEPLRKAFTEAYRRKFTAQIYNFTKQSVDLRVYITNQSGIVIFDSDHGRDEGKDYSTWRDVSLTLKGEYGARSSSDNPELPVRTMYVASPILYGNDIVGVLTVGKPMTNANFFVAAAQDNMQRAGILVTTAVMFLTVMVIVWVTRPIRILTNYVRDVRDGKRVQLPKLGDNEFGTLGRTFEEMREALEGKKYVEKYVQTLTHELKSPLSGIQGAAELLREELPVETRNQFIDNIDRETKRMRSLVEKLLNLSSLQARREKPDFEDIDLRILLEECVDALSIQAQVKGVEFDVTVSDELHVKGERFWLRESIVNLLMNAIEFAPNNSAVSITLKSSNGNAILEIQDSGPGIPEWAIGRIYEQFFSLPRPDTGKKSTGLGLSLVKEVAELHAGRITLQNLAQGGTKAEFVLPLQNT